MSTSPGFSPACSTPIARGQNNPYQISHNSFIGLTGEPFSPPLVPWPSSPLLSAPLPSAPSYPAAEKKNRVKLQWTFFLCLLFPGDQGDVMPVTAALMTSFGSCPMWHRLCSLAFSNRRFEAMQPCNIVAGETLHVLTNASTEYWHLRMAGCCYQGVGTSSQRHLHTPDVDDPSHSFPSPRSTAVWLCFFSSNWHGLLSKLQIKIRNIIISAPIYINGNNPQVHFLLLISVSILI